MYRGRPTRSVLSCACAIALALLGCASGGGASSPSRTSPAPHKLVSSPAMGLVGLLLMDPFVGPPRAAGMTGVIVGYVISHPALDSDLSIHRDGQTLPVLAFKLNLVIVESSGAGGMQDLRGRGNLYVFYRPEGFSDTPLNYPPTLDGNLEIEADKIEFDGNINSDTYRFYMRMHETVVESRAFVFAGRTWRTPVSRTASDVMIGEFSDGFAGLAIASTNAMAPLSPQEKLIALVGPPRRSVRY
jgi:hypothetical protein